MAKGCPVEVGVCTRHKAGRRSCSCIGSNEGCDSCCHRSSTDVINQLAPDLTPAPVKSDSRTDIRPDVHPTSRRAVTLDPLNQ